MLLPQRGFRCLISVTNRHAAAQRCCSTVQGDLRVRFAPSPTGKLNDAQTNFPVRLFKGVSGGCLRPLFTSTPLHCHCFDLVMHVFFLFLLLKTCATHSRLHKNVALHLHDILCGRFLASRRPSDCSLQLHLCQEVWRLVRAAAGGHGSEPAGAWSRGVHRGHAGVGW